MAERVWRPGRPVPVGAILSVHRRGTGDPTYRVDGDRHWRGVRTPEGPATLLVEPRPRDGEVRASAWGPGAAWVVDRLPALLGDDDDPSGFVPDHPVLAEAWQRLEHVRIGRTGLVWESLVPAIIEQKVTGHEAFGGFRRLVRRYGEPAPGPGAERDLWLQPTPEQVATIPSWEWLRLPVDPARARAVLAAARVAPSLERTLGKSGAEVERALTSVPGIGIWTAAEVRQRAHGDPDAVSFGDYHVARNVGWAVAGEIWDDDQLADFLEPYRPHRGRVTMLVMMARIAPPRRGPRMAPRTHLPR